MIERAKEKIREKKEWLKENKKRILAFGTVFVGLLLFLYYAVLVLHFFLRGKGVRFLLPLKEIFTKPPSYVLQFYLLVVIGVVYLLWLTFRQGYHSQMQTIAGRVRIPAAAGSHEHGSARFLREGEREALYQSVVLGSETSWLKEAGRREDDRLTEKAEKIERWQRKKEEVIEKCQGRPREELREAMKALLAEKEELLAAWEAGSAEKEIPAGEIPTVSAAGIVLNYKKELGAERIQVMDKDRHILINGGTRAGKNRNILLQSIGMIAFSGKNALITDPKGENYLYTHTFLERLGYQTPVLDFREPQKSWKYNFLQPVIDAVDRDDIPAAVDACWDLTAQLVGEPKGERIWTDGEAATIAGSILAVVYDNQAGEARQYQNMTNVYFFISEMAAVLDDKGTTKLQKYADALSDSHPAKGLFGISKVAPRRTAGSFYTAALATLRLFSNPLIYDMTRETTISLKKVFDEKTMLFLILPDEKKTYHPLATLFTAMFYQAAIQKAAESGGVLPKIWYFLLDEFGNFSKIPTIDAMLTAGAGRGIFFTLVLQSFAQLDKIYEKDAARIIQDNCEVWIYLNAGDSETRKAFSARLGNYTIYSYSKSTQYDRYANPSSAGHSANLTSRELLKEDELGQIERPYLIVSGRGYPFVSYSPDLSEWSFNDMYGLGDREHNQKVNLIRSFERREEMGPKEIALWGIWKKMKQGQEQEQEEREKYKKNWVTNQELPM